MLESTSKLSHLTAANTQFSQTTFRVSQSMKCSSITRWRRLSHKECYVLTLLTALPSRYLGHWATDHIGHLNDGVIGVSWLADAAELGDGQTDGWNLDWRTNETSGDDIWRKDDARLRRLHIITTSTSKRFLRVNIPSCGEYSVLQFPSNAKIGYKVQRLSFTASDVQCCCAAKLTRLAY